MNVSHRVDMYNNFQKQRTSKNLALMTEVVRDAIKLQRESVKKSVWNSVQPII